MKTARLKMDNQHIHRMHDKPLLDSIFAVSQAPGEKRHTDELVKAGGGVRAALPRPCAWVEHLAAHPLVTICQPCSRVADLDLDE
jgi:hypothetical protein